MPSFDAGVQTPKYGTPERVGSEQKELVIASAGLEATLRAVILNICAEIPAFRYSGHAATASALITSCVTRAPHVLLLDDSCLATDLLGLLRLLHREFPLARELIVGACLDLRTLSQALRAGLWGVVARERAAEDLPPALRAVARGELWLSRFQLSNVLMHTSLLPQPHTTVVSDLRQLTPRENAVVRGVLCGHSNKEIARALGIAEHTVKIHLHHVYAKLHLHGRVELVLRHGPFLNG